MEGRKLNVFSSIESVRSVVEVMDVTEEYG